MDRPGAISGQSLGIVARLPLQLERLLRRRPFDCLASSAVEPETREAALNRF